MIQEPSCGSALIGILIGIGLMFLWIRRRDSGREEMARPKMQASDRFRRAFEASPAAVGFFSSRGHWVWFNARMLALLGYSKDQLARKSYFDLTHPDDRKSELLYVRRILSGVSERFAMRKRFRRPDGKWREVSVLVSAVPKRDGGTECLQCVIDEKTDLHMEGKEETIGRLMTAFDETAFIRLDAHGEIVAWSKGAEDLLGYPAPEMIGKLRSATFREEDIYSDRPTADLRRAAEEGIVEQEEWRMRRDGEPIRCRSVLCVERRGETVEGFFEILNAPKPSGTLDQYRQSYERLKQTADRRIQDLESELAKAEKKTQTLQEAAATLRESAAETMSELKRMTTGLREEIERRQNAERDLNELREELARSSGTWRERLAGIDAGDESEEEPAERTFDESGWTAIEREPVAEALMAVRREQKSGRFIARRDDHWKEFLFEKGRILACSSNEPRLHLGPLLVARGFIDDEQCSYAEEMQRRTGIAFGRLLLRAGILPERRLRDVMVEKAREEVIDLFRWTEGEHVFVTDDVPSNQLVPLRLDVRPIISLGLQLKGRSTPPERKPMESEQLAFDGSRVEEQESAAELTAERLEPEGEAEEPGFIEPTQKPERRIVASSSKSSKKYHYDDCPSARRISDERRIHFVSTAAAEEAGLEPCRTCTAA